MDCEDGQPDVMQNDRENLADQRNEKLTGGVEKLSLEVSLSKQQESWQVRRDIHIHLFGNFFVLTQLVVNVADFQNDICNWYKQAS